MKKFIKRLIATGLLLVVTIKTIYLPSYAEDIAQQSSMADSEVSVEESGWCGVNVKWSLDADTGILNISGSGSMDDYSFNGHAPWYDVASDIECVSIQDGVTSIGDYAFYNCVKLTLITISESVTSIGDEAFYKCVKLTSIRIPGRVTKIGRSAFESCTALATIILPAGLTSIGRSAFRLCESLISITIPSGVTSIEFGTFEWCTSLTSITIPDSVTSIGNQAFYRCTSLLSILVDSNNTYYSADEGVLFNKEKTKLIFFPAGKMDASYVIPDSVTSIERTAFEYGENLKSITIPSSVTNMGSFAGCGLETVIFLDGVKAVGGNFKGCGALVSVTIPKSATSIKGGTFAYCDNLKDVFYEGTKQEWESITIGNGNDSLKNATIHYNSEMPVQEKINFGIDRFTFGQDITGYIGDEINSLCVYTSKDNNTQNLTFKSSDSSIVEISTITHGIGEYIPTGNEHVATVPLKLKAEGTATITITSPEGLSESVDIVVNNKSKVYYYDGDNKKEEVFLNNLEDYVSQTSSSTYSPQLAHMLAAMSCAAYNEDAVKDSLESLGFEDYKTEYEANSIIDYSFGRMQTKTGKNLVLVTVQGTIGELTGTQWMSNFTTGPSAWFGMGLYLHEGFAEAWATIYEDLLFFLDGDLSDTIFVTTGHSRGGAVSNLLALSLIYSDISKENIYSYNFACPDVATGTDCEWNPDDEYSSIFNMGYTKDYVPVLPRKLGDYFQIGSLFTTSWGKFGRSYWWAFDWSDDEEFVYASKDAIECHDSKNYLSYFREENTIEKFRTWSEIESEMKLPSGKSFLVACPVDVEIRNSNGKLIASVIDGVVNYYDSEYGDVIIVTDGSQKLIYVKGNEEVSINLIATDEGTMTYSVAIIDDNGDVASQKTFENVSLTIGKQMINTIEEANMSNVSLYVLDDKGLPNKEVLADGNGTEIPLDEPDYLLGDITGDGKVNNNDVSRLFAHIKKTDLITDEDILAMADITGDGKVNNNDVSRLFAHVKKTDLLW